MSSKVNTEPKGDLLPKLRFPEFQAAGGWQEVALVQLTQPITEKVGDAELTPVSITAGQGFVSQVSKFGRDISGDQYKNYTHLRFGDFAYNKGNSKKFPQGYVCQLKEFPEAAASSAFICFRLNADHDATFIQGAFEKNVHGVQLAKYITSGARSDGLLNIRPEDFFSISLSIPTEPYEEKKIAGCLSSIEALIVAESDKLEALERHKQSLLSQLFPPPGEIRPTLRLPEFRQAPDWQEKAVGDVFTLTRGNVLAMPLVDDVPSNEKPYPVYSSQTKNAGLAGYYSDYLYEDAITWTTDGANAGDVNYRSGRFFCTNVCGVLRSDEGYANPCVAALINGVAKRHVSYVGNPKLMNGVMAKIVVPFPSLEEQLQLTSILKSIDMLLNFQNNRVERLEEHKRGLLQQLYPPRKDILV
ncbi:restriction endonuclease subunit S [Croceicoccus hydrothermalis]|uniref:restriction endonuclease subunit S n=1 Tax=Croceicoccus hydrothermalis TaxID=2867964 RepID=UPI001EFA8636|nr:restriction endonuclease subunit S [Croceicoccus hydrothermalis]